jgi:branched-chain amino acid transport system ATP-binding protein
MTGRISHAGAIMRVEAVSMRFGGFTALSNVSIAFPAGQLTAIIGPNGAGKSTFFNVLSGAYVPTEGRVFFESRDITGTPQHMFARMGIAKSFQITNVFPQLSVIENVRIAVQALSRRFDLWTPRWKLHEMVEEARRLVDLVGLGHHALRHAENLAHGEQRALEIALALACAPRVLLLDEPTAGMSPEETMTMMRLIVRLAAERTVILVEHKMKLVMGICDHLVVLHHGELLAAGTPDTIRANAEVRRVYLGQSAA